MTEREEQIHNFLNHYQQGDRLVTEFKPMTEIRYDENLEKYSINIDEHGKYYNFENSGELINEFMTVFERIPRFQDSRTWTTAVYDSAYFNGYVKFRLVSDIKKRIIINGLTGSSCRFKRFDRLSISVNNSDDQRVPK